MKNKFNRCCCDESPIGCIICASDWTAEPDGPDINVPTYALGEDQNCNWDEEFGDLEIKSGKVTGIGTAYMGTQHPNVNDPDYESRGYVFARVRFENGRGESSVSVLFDRTDDDQGFLTLRQNPINSQKISITIQDSAGTTLVDKSINRPSNTYEYSICLEWGVGVIRATIRTVNDSPEVIFFEAFTEDVDLLSLGVGGQVGMDIYSHADESAGFTFFQFNRHHSEDATCPECYGTGVITECTCCPESEGGMAGAWLVDLSEVQLDNSYYGSGAIQSDWRGEFSPQNGCRQLGRGQTYVLAHDPDNDQPCYAIYDEVMEDVWASCEESGPPPDGETLLDNWDGTLRITLIAVLSEGECSLRLTVAFLVDRNGVGCPTSVPADVLFTYEKKANPADPFAICSGTHELSLVSTSSVQDAISWDSAFGVERLGLCTTASGFIFGWPERTGLPLPATITVQSL